MATTSWLPGVAVPVQHDVVFGQPRIEGGGEDFGRHGTDGVLVLLAEEVPRRDRVAVVGHVEDPGVAEEVREAASGGGRGGG